MSENYSALSKRASTIRLASSKLAAGMKSGGFKSLTSGHGIEFSGVRDYFVGDDVRSIDWNVTARMGRPFVKIFEEERELNVFFIVDESFSMRSADLRRSLKMKQFSPTGTGSIVKDGKNRLDTALETASLLLFAAEQISSPVGAVLFDGEIKFSIAPKNGKDHVMSIFSAFYPKAESEDDDNVKNGTALSQALSGAANILKKKSLVFVISDFRVKGWEKPLGFLASKHDVVVIRIADPLDSKIPANGSLLCCDPETGFEQILPTSSRSFSNSWLAENRNRVENWKNECIKKGAFPTVISTAEDPAVALSRFFSGRSRR